MAKRAVMLYDEAEKLEEHYKNIQRQKQITIILFINFLLTIGLLFGYIGLSEFKEHSLKDGIKLSMEPVLRDQGSQFKVIRENIESVPWKEKLRQHINSEQPAYYTRFPAPNPAVVDNPSIPPETYVRLLELSLIVYSPDHLNVIIRDAENIRWEIPFEDPNPHVSNPNYMKLSESNFICKFSTDPLDLIVIRKDTNEEIFRLADRFVFADRYIEFSFQMPTNQVHGFGERLYTFNFKPGTYTLFILDRSGEIEEGRPGFNAHGHHSVYIVREKSGKAHANLIRNVNAHEFTLDEKGKIRYQMNGGVIDLNFFLGENYEDATRKYHTYLGGWILPAFWMLGHQQSKWNGYWNTTHLREVLEKYEEHNLPLDTLNNDIEYTEGFLNFKIDEARYPPHEMKGLYNKYQKRYIPMCTPYVMAWGGPGIAYPNIDDLLVKTQNGTTYSPGGIYITDFMHPNCSQFYYAMLDQLNQRANISGIWLDGNEITIGRPSEEQILKFKTAKYYNLPWFPGTENFYHMHIPPVDNVHYGGVEEYDARALQCLNQAKHAFNYFKTRPEDPQRFPFVLSRGTTFGIGKYVRTFIPDYKSDWACLKISIPSCLVFNFFGIPFIGGDIGGNGGNQRTPPELMARWYQLGIFYPYARNHHMLQVENIDNYQEPYKYDGIYYETIALCLKLRYAFLKYYYTLYFLTLGTEFRSGSVFLPVSFVFYNEETMPAYDHQMHSEQFMVGENLLVTPVLFPSTDQIQAYFPNARWYDLRNNIEVPARGVWHTVIAPLPAITPYFLRGGSIFYKQNVDKVKSTIDLDSIFQVTIGLSDIDGNIATARGFILNVQSYDEFTVYDHCTFGDCLLEMKATFDFNKHELVFEATKKTLTSYGETQFISELNILGVEKSILREYQSVDIVSTDPIPNNSSMSPSLRAHSEEGWMQIILSSNIELRDGVKYIFSFCK